MAEADALRMVAEVVDKFSSPLRNLRSSLQGMSKDGGAHTKVLSDGLNKVEGAAKSAAQTATTVLNPALATIGVTGLGVTAALAGIQAAVRNFTTNASGLGQLGRDTGIAAQQLRDVQSILGKVGVDAGSSASGIQAFAESMRQARAGIGPIMEFLRTQGKTAEGRAYFNQLADDLMRSKDNGEALSKALKGMEGIEDPAGRRVYAEQVLRMGDAARLAEKHRGTIDEQLAKAGKEAGPLTPEMVKNAEAYDKAMGGLASTMKRIGTAIAMEVEGPLARVAVAIKGFLDDERKGATPAIVTTIRETVAYIESLDWGQVLRGFGEGFEKIKSEVSSAFGEVRTLLRELGNKDTSEGIATVFREIGKVATGAATAIRSVALALGALNDAKNFDFSAAGKKIGEIDRLTDMGAGKRSNAGPSKPTDAQTEALIGIITGGKPQDAERAQREAEAQRREQSKLTDEMRRLREALPDKKPGEATVQQQSFDASNPLAGLIHTASFGGGVGGSMARVGNLLARRGGGIYAPGGGSGGSYGEGRSSGLGSVPSVQPRAGGPGERIGRALRGEPQTGAGSLAGANPGDYKDVLDHIARSEGTANRPGGGYDTSLALGKFLPGGREQNLTGKTLDEIDALQTGMLNHPQNGFNSSAIGRYQVVRTTLRRMRQKLGLKGDDLYDEKTQDRIGAELARARGADPVGLKNEWASLVGEKNRRAVELMQQVPRGASTTPQDRPPSFGAGRRPEILAGLDDERRKPGGPGEDEVDAMMRRVREMEAANPESKEDADRRVAEQRRDNFINELRYRSEKGDKFGVPEGGVSSTDRERNVSLRELNQGIDAVSRNAAKRAGGNEDVGSYVGKSGGLAEFKPNRLLGLDEIRSRFGVPRADGEGFAAAYKRRQEDADRKASEFGGDGGKKLMDKASRSPMLGGGGTNVRGDVSVIVNKPGPDTKVSTSASGNLFRDVKLNRGVTMAPASQEN